MRVAVLYARVLLWTGLPVGVALGLLSHDLWYGVVIGIVVTAVNGTVVVIRRPVLGGDLSIRVGADPTVVRRRALEALGALPARIVTTDDVDHLVGRTGMSWQSWGERITIDLHPAGGSTEVRVRSRPKLKSTPYNYGTKDRRNVDFLVGVLTRSDA